MAEAHSDSPTSASPIADEILCPNCGYNLKTLTRADCPECGTDIQFAREQQSQIPWVYREEKGRIKTYWQTVWMLIRNNETFCQELTRPVNYQDANRFRWVTILLAFLPLIALTEVLFAFELLPLTAEYVTYALVADVSAFAALSLVTAAPYHALRHKQVSPEHLNRAATLLLYTCGPLALGFVVVGLVIPGLWYAAYSVIDRGFLYYFLAGGALLAILAAMLRDMIRIVRRMLDLGGSAFWAACGITAAWLGTAFVALIVIPLTFVFLSLINFSL